MKSFLKIVGIRWLTIFWARLFGSFLDQANNFLRWLTLKSHSLQMWIEWRFLSPEWMNHFGDQYYQWRKKRVSYWVERGVFNNLALANKKNPKVLELCSGDGFNTYHFYSRKSKSIVAVDFDKTALKHAKKWNKWDNIEYRQADIRTQFPDGKFNNIIWDAAIEHFTEIEIDSIMNKIKNALDKDGILSGYTLVEKAHDEKHLHQHEYEFKSKEDLLRFLKPYFKNVKVFETFDPDRHNLYFYASDSAVLPFDEKWGNQIEFKMNSLVSTP